MEGLYINNYLFLSRPSPKSYIVNNNNKKDFAYLSLFSPVSSTTSHRVISVIIVMDV